MRLSVSSSRTHTLLASYLSPFLSFSFCKDPQQCLEDSYSSDVNLSRERVRARTRRRRSFDHRHREVGITTTRGASAILHGGRRCSRIGTVDGRYARRRGWGGRDASGRLPRDASAQRAPYLRYTFARVTPDLSGPVTTSPPHRLLFRFI